MRPYRFVSKHPKEIRVTSRHYHTRLYKKAFIGHATKFIVSKCNPPSGLDVKLRDVSSLRYATVRTIIRKYRVKQNIRIQLGRIKYSNTNCYIQL